MLLLLLEIFVVEGVVIFFVGVVGVLVWVYVVKICDGEGNANSVRRIGKNVVSVTWRFSRSQYSRRRRRRRKGGDLRFITEFTGKEHFLLAGGVVELDR